MRIRAKEWEIVARVYQHPNIFDMTFTLKSERPITNIEAEIMANKQKDVLFLGNPVQIGYAKRAYLKATTERILLKKKKITQLQLC